MSVFSITPKKGNPVTSHVLDSVCNSLGVSIKDDERDEYRTLLAVFHDAAEELMAVPDVAPNTDLDRFPRKNVHFPSASENTRGAWAWKFDIEEVQADGILKGKSVALKDNIAVKDIPMLMGTNFVKDYIPVRIFNTNVISWDLLTHKHIQKLDATVVTRVLEAGGHVVGKAVCENLCHSGTSHSAATGVVENPRANGYSSGGSSSGCGVLVSLGEVDMAIGADQGGSVRIPACNCGIVGFKVSRHTKWGIFKRFRLVLTILTAYFRFDTVHRMRIE
jgi:amidase